MRLLVRLHYYSPTRFVPILLLWFQPSLMPFCYCPYPIIHSSPTTLNDTVSLGTTHACIRCWHLGWRFWLFVVCSIVKHFCIILLPTIWTFIIPFSSVCCCFGGCHYYSVLDSASYSPTFLLFVTKQLDLCVGRYWLDCVDSCAVLPILFCFRWRLVLNVLVVCFCVDSYLNADPLLLWITYINYILVSIDLPQLFLLLYAFTVNYWLFSPGYCPLPLFLWRWLFCVMCFALPF